MSVEVKMNEFNTISGNINALYHQAAKAFDMFDIDMDILYLIAYLGEGCPQAELYKMTGMSKSTVNTAIKILFTVFANSFTLKSIIKSFQ